MEGLWGANINYQKMYLGTIKKKFVKFNSVLELNEDGWGLSYSLCFKRIPS